MTLFKRGEPMELGELIRVVAAKEYDIDPDAVSAEQYKRVYTGLYQHHLPAMADLDIIRYHQSENTVCLGDRASLLKPYLEISSEQASRDNRVVVGGVALAGMGLLGVTTSGVAPDYVVAIATGGLLLAATAMRIRGRHRASLTAHTGRTSIH